MERNKEIANEKLVLYMEKCEKLAIPTTSQSPDITIVTRMQYKFVEECFHSILSQTHKNFEWIILDNGSQGENRRFIRTVAAMDGRIRYYRNEVNYLGVKKDNEQGYLSLYDLFPLAKGRYVCVVDSDDTVEPDFLEKMLEAAGDGDMDMVVCGVHLFEQENPGNARNRVPTPYICQDVKEVGDRLETLYQHFRTIWAKIYKTSFFMEHFDWVTNFPMDIQNCNDTYVVLRLLRKSPTITFIPHVLYHYRITNSSIYLSQVEFKRHEEYDKLFLEGMALLKSWDKLNEANLSFLCLVHLHSMVDCIVTPRNAKGVPLADRFLFLQEVLKNRILNEYYNKTDERYCELIWYGVVNTCASLEQEMNPAQVWAYYNFYVFRLYKLFLILQEGKEIRETDIALYLSLVFAGENGLGLGKSFAAPFLAAILDENLLACFKNHEVPLAYLLEDLGVFKAVVMGDYTQALSLCRRQGNPVLERILQLTWKENQPEGTRNDTRHIAGEPEAGKVTDVAQHIKGWFDKTTLKNHIVLCLNTGQIENTTVYSQLLGVLFPEEKDGFLMERLGKYQ